MATERDCTRQVDRTAVSVTVTGTVQGVGFRPFVARVASEHGLAGSVKNTDEGVHIRLEGLSAGIERALKTIRNDPPRLSRIETVSIDSTTPLGEPSFDIGDSADAEGQSALVPPDTAICSACLDDIHDEESRFHRYWATACVNCGPRFSITQGLPYDRERTGLKTFSPCKVCSSEYEDPTDRRFHAQTIACPTCGPSLSFLTADGETVTTGEDAIEAAAGRLDEGAIVGVKGAGGSHLACRARNVAAVERLRERLERPAKPFATMAPSIESARSYATVTDPETLLDERRPIVLLPKGDGAEWLDAIAPGIGTVGVMLPYSGLHYLFFDTLRSDPLVMTSANRPGEPMATTVEALLDLDDVLDAALVHDRPIENRCDDSVHRALPEGMRPLRRSRGYVPEPLDRPVRPDDSREVVALGGESDVTVAVTRGESVVPSQHIGDISDPETASFHRDVTARLLDLLGVEPAVVAHDEHPDMETTRIAEERPERSIAVQHHHAHGASLLAERGRERAIVVAADGTGYGPEGVIRGGEVLDADLESYERVGGISRFRLPGGKAAVREPARVAAELLHDRSPTVARDLLTDTGTVDSKTAAKAVLEATEAGMNSPPTTSAGRFLDAAAALCGICTERRYQGEPAMRLEAFARPGTPVAVDPPIRSQNGQQVMDARAAMRTLADLLETHSDADVAATAQRLIADGLSEIAIDAATGRGVDAIGFTGGIAYNAAIDRRIRTRVRDTGFSYLAHEQVPPGDGGLSYGQAIVASARLAADSDGAM